MSPRVLVYGYGNPGRVDDGLGPAFVNELSLRCLEDVSLETAYQLQIEDADVVARHEAVVFVDADTSIETPFELRPLEARTDVAFTTHAVAPEGILALAHEHFGCRTAGFVLGIRGAEFNAYDERLSDQAQANLLAAADHLERVLREGTLLAEPASTQ